MENGYIGGLFFSTRQLLNVYTFRRHHMPTFSRYWNAEKTKMIIHHHHCLCSSCVMNSMWNSVIITAHFSSLPALDTNSSYLSSSCWTGDVGETWRREKKNLFKKFFYTIVVCLVLFTERTSKKNAAARTRQKGKKEWLGLAGAVAQQMFERIWTQEGKQRTLGTSREKSEFFLAVCALCCGYDVCRRRWRISNRLLAFLHVVEIARAIFSASSESSFCVICFLFLRFLRELLLCNLQLYYGLCVNFQALHHWR